MSANQRRDLADQDPDRDGEEDDDDQRRLEAGKENLEADLLRILQGDDGTRALRMPTSQARQLTGFFSCGGIVRS